MGRELKRVPLDFDAPMETWKGYLNPFTGPLPCHDCGSTGHNPATRELEERYYDSEGFGWRWSYDYGINPEGKPADRPPWRIVGDCRRWCSSITQDEVQALIDAGRLIDFTHTWKSGDGWKRREDGYIPTDEEVNQWNDQGMGHDGLNRWILVETRAKRLGIWGQCETCKGQGEVPNPDTEEQSRYEAWTREEPPTGDGYQLWGTTSEGDPRSPVFASLEELCFWCEKNATTFADNKATFDEWFNMLSPGGLVHHKEGQMVFI